MLPNRARDAPPRFLLMIHFLFSMISPLLDLTAFFRAVLTKYDILYFSCHLDRIKKYMLKLYYRVLPCKVNHTKRG